MGYFNREEFKCGCGCGSADMSIDLLDKLEDAREEAGVPFIITSGYRCVTHNYKVGGKATSAHTTGMAVDILANNSRNRWLILHGLVSAGFNRIGISDDFIHADVDMDKSEEVVWLY